MYLFRINSYFCVNYHINNNNVNYAFMLLILPTTIVSVLATSADRCPIWSITAIQLLCQRLAKSQWFSPGTLVSSTNKTDRHDMAEILLKVALNTINETNQSLHKQKPVKNKNSIICSQSGECVRVEQQVHLWIIVAVINLCWWTISPRGYHPPSSQGFGIDMTYKILVQCIFTTEIYQS